MLNIYEFAVKFLRNIGCSLSYLPILIAEKLKNN
jgi:hypothetical protein